MPFTYEECDNMRNLGILGDEHMPQRPHLSRCLCNACIDARPPLPEGPALNVRGKLTPEEAVKVARAGLENPQTVETGKMFPTPIKSDEQIAKDKAKVSKQRKDTPIYSGAMAYFPLALAAVAQLSKAGNDKHNPGQPLHWSRDKSNDHADCIARHLLELGTVDPDDGFLHDVKLAWRALANLQIRLEGGK